MDVAGDFGGAVHLRDDSLVIVATAEAELGPMRRAVSEFVSDHDGGIDLTTDLEIVASELATNVMQHSNEHSVTVVVRQTPIAWELNVSGADDLSELGPNVAPPPTSRSGRGLVVVRAIMDEVKLARSDGRAFIRCRKFRT